MDRKQYLKEYYKEYYKKEEKRKGILNSRRKYAEKNRQIYLDWKKTLSCSICGENHPACIEFHHKNPEEKDYCVSNLSGKSLSFILKEVSKCDILCANCHRKLHNPINEDVV